MSGGVPFGASSTFQLASSKSATPASLKVGTLGSAAERALPVTANGLTEPEFHRGLGGGKPGKEQIDVAADHVGHRLGAAG